jgi:type II secretory pathway pseudopilin PulG
MRPATRAGFAETMKTCSLTREGICVMRKNLSSHAGFTMAEMTIILTTISILGAAAAPVMGDFVNDARLARAQQDTRAIASAVSRMTADVMGHHAQNGGWATFALLVGPGAAQDVATGAGQEWAVGVGASQAGALEDQLMLNSPGYPTHAWSQVNWIRGWHGPYLDAGVGADPWGHRYAVNVKFLKGGAFDTFVVSAGPNGIVETPFQADGTVAHGDDIIVVLSPGN